MFKFEVSPDTSIQKPLLNFYFTNNCQFIIRTDDFVVNTNNNGILKFEYVLEKWCLVQSVLKNTIIVKDKYHTENKPFGCSSRKKNKLISIILFVSFLRTLFHL